jgi:hypothetical protein
MLDPPDATSDEAGVPLLDEDYLVLSTIHSAKGQKWAALFFCSTPSMVPAIRSCHWLNAGRNLPDRVQRWRKLGFCKRKYLRTNCPWREGSGVPQIRQVISRSTVSGPASPLIKW